eukprot:4568425-Amphidinium_carterae.1
MVFYMLPLLGNVGVMEATGTHKHRWDTKAMKMSRSLSTMYACVESSFVVMLRHGSCALLGRGRRPQQS